MYCMYIGWLNRKSVSHGFVDLELYCIYSSNCKFSWNWTWRSEQENIIIQSLLWQQLEFILGPIRNSNCCRSQLGLHIKICCAVERFKKIRNNISINGNINRKIPFPHYQGSIFRDYLLPFRHQVSFGSDLDRWNHLSHRNKHRKPPCTMSEGIVADNN